jgi:hypothetical protein
MDKTMTIFEIVLTVVSALYTVFCILTGSPNHDMVVMGNLILGVILTAKNCLIMVINKRFNDYLELKHVEFAWKREKLEAEDNG